MFNMVQYHHGISCSDIERTKRVLSVLGFTDIQPGAPQPIVIKNEPDNPIGQMTAPVLGDEYHTHYVENPRTGQQIDLIEIQAAAMVPRPCTEPAQGDLVIAFPVDDPDDMYARMQAEDDQCTYSPPTELPEEDGIRFIWRDGQHSILTRKQEPFAILHYSRNDFENARRFYEYVLEVEILKLHNAADGSERYSMQGIGGRMEIRVSEKTKQLDFRAWGKHYPSANHFRLIERNFSIMKSRLEETGLGRYILPPAGGFAFLHGPTSETVETFEKGFAP